MYLNGQESSDRGQGHILSNSERKDLFDVNEDDTSLEDNSANVEGVVLDRDGLAWVSMPMQVALNLLHERDGGQDISTIETITQSLDMDVKITKGRETQQMLMVARPGDTHTVERMRHIVAGLGRDLIRGTDTTLYYVQ